MPKLWMMLGTAGTLLVATEAMAQDEAAFRTAMMARCATIADKGARLACYDAAQRSGPVAMPPAAGSGSAPLASAPLASAPSASRGAGFGREEVRERRVSTAPNEIRDRAVAASEDGAGYWTIRLESGGTWKMIEREAMFQPPNRNEAVRIRKGALGGYLMEVNHQGAVRVERVD